MTLLLLGMACSGMPSSIPNQPGSIDAAIAPDLFAAVSPDVPYLLWAAASQLVGEGYRTCPQVLSETNGYAIVAHDCYDSVGLLWDGTLSWDIDGASNTLSFNKFRVDGMRGAWEADGTIIIDEAAHDVASAYIVTTKLALTSLDDPERVFWIKTKGSVSQWPDQESSSEVWTGWDEYDGTIGISDWGTAEIEGDRIVSGQANGCAFADHWAGTVEVTGANTAVLDYSLVDTSDADTAPAAGEAGGDTRPRLDTGDTGGPADTGDTSVPTDTGDTSDTSDSGVPTDTGDTGNEGGPDDEGAFPVWPDEDELRVCGQCNSLTVEGNLVEGCFELDRSFEYPFFTEFPY